MEQKWIPKLVKSGPQEKEPKRGREKFQEKINAAKGKMAVHCGFWGGLIPNNIESLEGLIKSGVLGIKAFLTHSGIDEFPQQLKSYMTN